MLEDQALEATMRTGGNLFTVKVGHYVGVAGTWRDCIGTVNEEVIQFTLSKRQSVSMPLATCIQQKEISIVTTITGGEVLIAKVGPPAETATT